MVKKDNVRQKASRGKGKYMTETYKKALNAALAIKRETRGELAAGCGIHNVTFSKVYTNAVTFSPQLEKDINNYIGQPLMTILIDLAEQYGKNLESCGIPSGKKEIP